MKQSAVLKLSFNPSLFGIAWHMRWDDKRKKWVKTGAAFPGQWYVFLRTRVYPSDDLTVEQRRQSVETISPPLFTASTSEACHQWIRENREKLTKPQ